MKNYFFIVLQKCEHDKKCKAHIPCPAKNPKRNKRLRWFDVIIATFMLAFLKNELLDVIIATFMLAFLKNELPVFLTRLL